MNGVELIAAERERQKVQKGWTAEHDDGHVNGELAVAAVAYALEAADLVDRRGKTLGGPIPSAWWPWEDGWKPSKDPIRDLTRAGALIAAELDRLQRDSET